MSEPKEQELDLLNADLVELNVVLRRREDEIYDLRRRRDETARSIADLQSKARQDKLRLVADVNSKRPETDLDGFLTDWSSLAGLNPEAVKTMMHNFANSIEANRNNQGFTPALAVDREGYFFARVEDPVLHFVENSGDATGVSCVFYVLDGMIDYTDERIKIEDGTPDERRGVRVVRFDEAGLFGSVDEIDKIEDGRGLSVDDEVKSNGRVLFIGESAISKAVSERLVYPRRSYDFDPVDLRFAAFLGALTEIGIDLNQVITRETALRLTDLPHRLQTEEGFRRIVGFNLGEMIGDGSLYYSLLATGLDKEQAVTLCAKIVAEKRKTNLWHDANAAYRAFDSLVSLYPGAKQLKILAILFGIDYPEK